MKMTSIRDRITGFKRVRASEIVLNERNWRQHPAGQREALNAVLADVGIAGAVIAYHSDRNGGRLTLIDGELRTTTDPSLEWPVLILDVTDEEADRLLASYDPIAALATANRERLTSLIKNIPPPGQSLAAYFEQMQNPMEAAKENGAQRTGRRKAGKGGDEYLDEVTRLNVPKRANSGDLWQLGPHRLLVGDCTVGENVARLFAARAGRVFGLTSPPYNAADSAALSCNRFTSDTLYNVGGDDDLPPDRWRDLVTECVTQSLTVCDLFCLNVQPLAGNKVALLEALYQLRHHFADLMVWDKYSGQIGQPAMAPNVMNSNFELLAFFTKERHPSRALPLASFRGTVPNVYHAPPQRNNTYFALHAASFPLHLPTHLLTHFVPADGLIYDPMAGTGTTLIAAHRQGHTCYLCELQPEYADIILHRFQVESDEEPERV